MSRLRIQARPDLVYRLAAEIEFWPALSPQIRSARLLRRAPGGRPERLIDLRARRGWLPVFGRLVQRLEPERGRITYRVAGGHSAGATCAWVIGPAPDGISTELAVIGSAGFPFSDALLDDLKRVAEGGSLSGA